MTATGKSPGIRKSQPSRFLDLLFPQGTPHGAPGFFPLADMPVFRRKKIPVFPVRESPLYFGHRRPRAGSGPADILLAGEFLRFFSAR